MDCEVVKTPFHVSHREQNTVTGAENSLNKSLKQIVCPVEFYSSTHSASHWALCFSARRVPWLSSHSPSHSSDMDICRRAAADSRIYWFLSLCYSIWLNSTHLFIVFDWHCGHKGNKSKKFKKKVKILPATSSLLFISFIPKGRSHCCTTIHWILLSQLPLWLQMSSSLPFKTKLSRCVMSPANVRITWSSCSATADWLTKEAGLISFFFIPKRQSSSTCSFLLKSSFASSCSHSLAPSQVSPPPAGFLLPTTGN